MKKRDIIFRIPIEGSITKFRVTFEPRLRRILEIEIKYSIPEVFTHGYRFAFEHDNTSGWEESLHATLIIDDRAYYSVDFDSPEVFPLFPIGVALRSRFRA